MKATLLLTCFLTCLVQAQTPYELLDPGLRDLFHEALSGERAKEHVIEITRHHRIQGSRQYRDAANYVLGELRKYGCSDNDAYIETFKSDGRVTYQTWQSPSGWDISSAELRMVEPSDEVVVKFPEIAMSVMTYSNTGDVTAELVWVGAGTSDGDYAGKDVKGKFVLATGYGGEVHRLAVLKYGAKAVICYLDDDRAKEHPDMLQYTGMWPRTEELEKVTFGFNLTKRQGDKLKNLLETGRKVVMHGWVKGIGLEPYFMDVVVAHIKGRREGELVFSAHLDHPKESANDNASGSGAILDIARTVRELIDTKRLGQPERSFTFVWVPEWNGTMAYIDAHPELKGPLLSGNFLGDMNLDMVGENPELLHSEMSICRTPRSIGSCINDVVENMAEMVDRMDIRTLRGSRSAFNYRITPYSGGSDHMMFIDRKIPGVMFSHSDYTHHTSEDTPDKVDPVELERSELIALGSMWYLSNLTPRQAFDVIDLVRANAGKRLGMLALTNRTYIASQSKIKIAETWADAINRLNYAIQNEIDAGNSILTFNNSDKIILAAKSLQLHLGTRFQILFDQVRAQVEEIGYRAELPPPLASNTDGRIPQRLTRGPLDFRLPESKLPAAEAAWFSSKDFPFNGDERFELVNFMDGKLTVADIRNALSAEFSSKDPESVTRYIEDLVTVGVVSWKK